MNYTFELRIIYKNASKMSHLIYTATHMVTNSTWGDGEKHNCMQVDDVCGYIPNRNNGNCLYVCMCARVCSRCVSACVRSRRFYSRVSNHQGSFHLQSVIQFVFRNVPLVKGFCRFLDLHSTLENDMTC